MVRVILRTVYITSIFCFLLIVKETAAQSNHYQSPGYLQEKVYLSTNKCYYYTGERIWFSVFVNYHSRGLKDTLSKVLYVDLINSEKAIVSSCIIPIEEGRGSGSISIINNLPPGDYYLMAYTNWMRNYGAESFFYKSIPILDPHYTIKSNNQLAPRSDERLAIVPAHSSYHTREKITLRIYLPKNAEGGSFSVAVTDDEMIKPVSASDNIMNEYPLSDELPKSMLPVFKYKIERGIGFSGIYHGVKMRVKGKLMIVEEGLASIHQAELAKGGKFALDDMWFYDTTRFIASNGIAPISITPKEPAPEPSSLPHHNFQVVRSDSVWSFYNNADKSTLLKEVTVSAKKEPPKYESPMGKPDYYFKSEEFDGYASLALAITIKIPYYRLTSANGHYQLLGIRGGAEPIVYIDNAQVFSSGDYTVGDRLDALSPFMIDHIEVNTMIGAGLGANGNSGAIYVYSNKGRDRNNIPGFKIRGFDKPIAFEMPDYEDPKTDKNSVDNRSTIYWNPKVELLPEQKRGTEVSFFSADHQGKYRITIEGITNLGTPLHKEVFIVIE